MMNQVEIQLFVMNSNFNSMISSKILNTSLLVSFEPEETVKFDAISLKLLTVIIYIIEILASAILMTFVVYETRGWSLQDCYKPNFVMWLWSGKSAFLPYLSFKFLFAHILLCLGVVYKLKFIDRVLMIYIFGSIYNS